MKLFKQLSFKKTRKKTHDFKQELRTKIGREQFLKLLERGLSFPVALR